MPLKYLEELEKAALPLKVTEPDAVRKVVLLQSALLVDAELGSGGAAVVVAVTPRGWAMLEKLKSRKWRDAV